MLTQNWCEASGCGNGAGWTPRPKVSWSSLVAPWRTVLRCKVEKNTAHLFRNKFPVNYRSSSKNHFKFPGIFKPILGNESVVSLWRKRHVFSKRSKRWRGFPPDGMFKIWLVYLTRNRLGQIPSHHKIRMLNPWKKTGYCHIVINHWLHPKEKSVMVTTWSMGEWGMFVPLQNDSCYD